MAKSKSKHTRKVKSFSDMRGSKSDIFKGVTGEQLGHGRQLPNINPPPMGGSPLQDPTSPTSYGIGNAMGNNPSGEEYY